MLEFISKQTKWYNDKGAAITAIRKEICKEHGGWWIEINETGMNGFTKSINEIYRQRNITLSHSSTRKLNLS